MAKENVHKMRTDSLCYSRIIFITLNKSREFCKPKVKTAVWRKAIEGDQNNICFVDPISPKIRIFKYLLQKRIIFSVNEDIRQVAYYYSITDTSDCARWNIFLYTIN